MTDFYVQVKSNASTVEFPDNASNKFKNRLPNVLLFRELGWKVGLSSITLPVSQDTVRIIPQKRKRMVLSNPLLFQFRWFEGWSESMRSGSEMFVTLYEFGHPSPFANTETLAFDPTSGTELMTEIRNRYMWSMGYQAEEGHFIEYDKIPETIQDTRYKKKDKVDEYVEFKDDDDRFEYHSPPLKYIVMKPVENGECVIENRNTFAHLIDTEFPSVRIGLELAIKMRWIEWRKYVWSGAHAYLLGPNLRKEFPTHRMPDSKDIPKENDEKLYYKTDDTYLHLSMFVNWVFTDLDRSFDEAFGNRSLAYYNIPKRALNVYSNVGQSVITGDKVADLLRQVPYNPQESMYEPRHIQYIPLRSDMMDIIEIQVSESDGSLADFDTGDTVVTLHFKQ